MFGEDVLDKYVGPLISLSISLWNCDFHASRRIPSHIDHNDLSDKNKFLIYNVVASEISLEIN